MVGRIYKIINDINHKVYIGKTFSTIEQRFAEHKRDSCKTTKEQRPLYSAMRKYRQQHFFVELVEECEGSILSEREQYWIQQYDSYHNGYNATLGGDGQLLYDYDQIATFIQNQIPTKQICEQLGCSADIVYLVAKNNHLTLARPDIYQNLPAPTAILQYDLSGNYIQEFESIADATRWLHNNDYVKKICGGVRGHIAEVCQHKRQTAYKFKWEYKTPKS